MLLLSLPGHRSRLSSGSTHTDMCHMAAGCSTSISEGTCSPEASFKKQNSQNTASADLNLCNLGAGEVLRGSCVSGTKPQPPSVFTELSFIARSFGDCVCGITSRLEKLDRKHPKSGDLKASCAADAPPKTCVDFSSRHSAPGVVVSVWLGGKVSFAVGFLVSHQFGFALCCSCRRMFYQRVLRVKLFTITEG